MNTYSNENERKMKLQLNIKICTAAALLFFLHTYIMKRNEYIIKHAY